MDALRINEYVTQQSRTMNLVYQQRKGPADLNQEIKMIEKKIRQCQKRIDEEKRRKEDSMPIDIQSSGSRRITCRILKKLSRGK